MNSTNHTERIELPDGTQVTISVAGDRIEYTVNDGASIDETVEYTPDDARTQAETIRQREAASWDTIYPEQAGPVLDVADALREAARIIDSESNE